MALKYMPNPLRLKPGASAAPRSRVPSLQRGGPHDQRIHRHHGRTRADDGVDIQFRNQALLVCRKLGDSDEYVGEAIQINGGGGAENLKQTVGPSPPPPARAAPAL